MPGYRFNPNKATKGKKERKQRKTKLSPTFSSPPLPVSTPLSPDSLQDMASTGAVPSFDDSAAMRQWTNVDSIYYRDAQSAMQEQERRPSLSAKLEEIFSTDHLGYSSSASSSSAASSFWTSDTLSTFCTDGSQFTRTTAATLSHIPASDQESFSGSFSDRCHSVSVAEALTQFTFDTPAMSVPTSTSELWSSTLDSPKSTAVTTRPEPSFLYPLETSLITSNNPPKLPSYPDWWPLRHLKGKYLEAIL